jgi:hypothetical protein
MVKLTQRSARSVSRSGGARRGGGRLVDSTERAAQGGVVGGGGGGAPPKVPACVELNGSKVLRRHTRQGCELLRGVARDAVVSGA